MKGTPFYTGEYSVRRGPAEDRINLWPLLYYRDPALSVLWPIVEKTEDHFAVRPFVSVYGLDEEERVYNVLWPLSCFDRQDDEHRIFPLYWGDDYCTVFPLYWHEGEPFGEGGYDRLIPLWSYESGGKGGNTGYSAHVLWPFFHRKNYPGNKGGRVWPLYGSYTREERRDTFFAWPLGRRWSDSSTGRDGHMVLPLYCYERHNAGMSFFSLPYSHVETDTGEEWSCVPPVYYGASDRDRSLMLTPLYLRGKDRLRDSSWDLLLPAYYRSQDEEQSLLLSLPWSSCRRSDGSGWELLPPLFYHFESETQEQLITPLYSRGRNTATGTSWDALFPFYYREESADGDLLATLLGGYETDAAGNRWLIYPLLSSGSRHEDRGNIWVMAPLIHARWNSQGATHHCLPFYYWNGWDRTLVSPLASRWCRNDRETTLVPPVLSWLTEDERKSDLWLFGGMAHLSWGVDAAEQHVLPVCYWNRVSGSFVSPAFAKGHWEGADWRVVPPLLSAYAQDGEEKHLFSALGLFHQEWGRGPEHLQGHLIPLYYYEGRDLLLTPLFGWDRAGEEKGFFYPATPLFGVRTGKETGSWLFPVYSCRNNRATGRKHGSMLWGSYSFQDGKGKAGLFPLFSYRDRGPLDSEVPEGRNWATFGTHFRALLLGHRRNELQIWAKWAPGQDRKTTPELVRTRVRSNGLFPLWSYESRETEGTDEVRKKGSVLFLLADYRHEIDRPAATGELNDYTRSRVLWRLWHYERLNGEVSVDMPGITYDSRPDGFRKFSFLWRVFRYEKGPEGTKLDVIIPLVRRQGKTATQGTEGTK